MDFVAVVDQVSALLRQRGRVAYRTLKRQFQLDDEALEDLKIELIDSQRVAIDEQGTVLVWTGAVASPPAPAATPAPASAPLAYTPSYLTEKILTSRSALEGERKQVTVLFADLKGSMELLADRDPEEARHLCGPHPPGSRGVRSHCGGRHLLLGGARGPLIPVGASRHRRGRGGNPRGGSQPSPL